MITEGQKQDGKFMQNIVKEYHKFYNKAWSNLDFTKDTKRTLYRCGAILILGAVGSYVIVNKK
jgi:hypothetical protein